MQVVPTYPLVSPTIGILHWNGRSVAVNEPLWMDTFHQLKHTFYSSSLNFSLLALSYPRITSRVLHYMSSSCLFRLLCSVTASQPYLVWEDILEVSRSPDLVFCELPLY